MIPSVSITMGERPPCESRCGHSHAQVRNAVGRRIGRANPRRPRRSGSLQGLPVANSPAGHQQSLMTVSRRAFPALEPLNTDAVSSNTGEPHEQLSAFAALRAEQSTVFIGASARMIDSDCWQPRTPNTNRANEPTLLTKVTTISGNLSFEPRGASHEAGRMRNSRWTCSLKAKTSER